MCCHSDGRSATDAPDEHMLQHHVAVAVVSQDGDDFVVLSSSATLDSRVEHEMADARMYPRTTIEAAGSSSKALWVRHSLPEKVYLEYWDGGVISLRKPRLHYSYLRFLLFLLRNRFRGSAYATDRLGKGISSCVCNRLDVKSTLRYLIHACWRSVESTVEGGAVGTGAGLGSVIVFSVLYWIRS